MTVVGCGPTRQLSRADEEKVLERVKAILARGNVARFSRQDRISGHSVVKHVDSLRFERFNDNDADLIGCWSSGSTVYVAPWDAAYTLTEITPEQARQERNK